MAEYKVSTYDPVGDIDPFADFADFADFVPVQNFDMFWRLRKICPTRRHAVAFVQEMERQSYERQVSILVEKIGDVQHVH